MRGNPLESQKAASARRCIKTYGLLLGVDVSDADVRKHRAPESALRLWRAGIVECEVAGQIASSTIRCI